MLSAVAIGTAITGFLEADFFGFLDSRLGKPPFAIVSPPQRMLDIIGPVYPSVDYIRQYVKYDCVQAASIGTSVKGAGATTTGVILE